MEKYEEVDIGIFDMISSNTVNIKNPDKYNYNFCEECGNNMVSDAQKGIYICSICNLQQEIVGGLNDCDPSSSSVVKMCGNKSIIRHRSGKDTTDQIGEKYYKKFISLNETYIAACVDEAIKTEIEERTRELKELEKSGKYSSSPSSIPPEQADYSELSAAVAKSSRIPNEILISVARTYAEVFLFSKKKDFGENGELLEVRDSRNRGTKLWGLIAYLLLQECARKKHPFSELEAVKFVSPQQQDVSIAVGDRIARDYFIKGYLNLPQINIAKGDENIEKYLKMLCLPEDGHERFRGFVAGIMKAVSNEGVAIRTEEKTQIIGSIYIIIKQLRFKISPETISKKCKIQTKTFINFAEIIMKNIIIFHNIFARFAIPDGITEKIIRKKHKIIA